MQYWLDLDKQMNHQVGLDSSSSEPLLRFCVKFYTPDPAQIEEEYTRYLFSLQVKRDLSLGQLQCNDNTAALMASYIVQGMTLGHCYKSRPMKFICNLGKAFWPSSALYYIIFILTLKSGVDEITLV